MKRLAVLMAVAFVDMMGLMIIWPLLPLYAVNLHASPTLVGLLAASFPVAQLTSSPIWGYVSDRYGRRPALLVGLGSSAIAYLVFGFAHTVWLLFLSRFVQGLGGGTTGVVQAYVADSMPPRERAKALGWLSAATSAGVIIGPALGSFMHRFGEAAPGVFAAALVLVNVAFAWKWLPESRWTQVGVAARGPATPRTSITMREAVQNIVQPAVRVLSEPGRPVSLLIWIYAFAMLAFNALPPIFSLYLHDRFGITADQIGYFFMVFGAVGVVMRTAPVGWFNARLGEVRTMRVGTLLLLAGFILVPLAPTLPLFVAAQILMPLGTALLFPANSALVSHRADPEEIGLTLGVQQTYRGIAAVLGPAYAGRAYEKLGPHQPFFISAGIILFVIFLTLRVREEAPARVAATA
ncbi:MAG TPA: MFS transporter [Gemmatimonadales bacterium]|jgi:multidrug resistance protein|nr:MFS transporter [Gemmatimonadales bacterium]